MYKIILYGFIIHGENGYIDCEYLKYNSNNKKVSPNE